MVIIRGQINNIPVTVTEQTTLSVPVYYLFEFMRKASNVKVYAIVLNASTHTGRIDNFEIEETDSPDPLTGKVELLPGEYSYKIYQQASSTNVDPGLTMVAASGFAWVEQGLCQVYKSSEIPVPEFSAPLTNNVYERAE